MKSVIDSRQEFRRVLIGGGVVLGILVAILVFVKAGAVVSDQILNRPRPQEPLAYQVLPIDRTSVGKFVVGQGFSASPDDISGEGEESVYRWGERGKTERFLEISFRDGFIDYQAKQEPEPVVGVSRVAEIKYAERLAWDFLQVGSLWDKRLTIEPETKLFFMENGGAESAVASFEEANLFRVYFRAVAGEDPYQYSVLAPNFETYLARVDVFGPTGQILSARLFPLFLGEGKRLSSLDGEKQLENIRRPEEGFLPEGAVAYILVKGGYMKPWEAQKAGMTQVFKALFD